MGARSGSPRERRADHACLDGGPRPGHSDDLRSCWSGTEDGDYHHDNRNGGSLAARKVTVSSRDVIVVAHWEALS